MNQITFKANKDITITVMFYIGDDRVAPLTYLEQYEENEHDEKWLNRLVHGLLFNIVQFNKRVEAKHNIKGMSNAEAVAYLMRYNNVRNAKTGIKIEGRFLGM